MALWTFTKDDVGFAWEEDGATRSNWDDGLDLIPGEEGFTNALALEKGVELGANVLPSYSGTPNYHARREAELLAEAESSAKS